MYCNSIKRGVDNYYEVDYLLDRAGRSNLCNSQIFQCYLTYKGMTINLVRKIIFSPTLHAVELLKGFELHHK